MARERESQDSGQTKLLDDDDDDIYIYIFMISKDSIDTLKRNYPN